LTPAVMKLSEMRAYLEFRRYCFERICPNEMVSLKSNITIGPKAKLFLAGVMPWLCGVILLPIAPPLILSSPFFSGFFIKRYGGGFLLALSPTALTIAAIWFWTFHSGASGDAGMGVAFGAWYFTTIIVVSGLMGPLVGWWWGRDGDANQKWSRRDVSP
jgi:hypothetical protein